MNDDVLKKIKNMDEKGIDKILNMDTKTLGYHLEMCKVIFGDESKATKFLEYKIKEQGIDEIVPDEGKLVGLLMHLHTECKADLDEHFKTSNSH
jgi:hypothetical protein